MLRKSPLLWKDYEALKPIVKVIFEFKRLVDVDILSEGFDRDSYIRDVTQLYNRLKIEFKKIRWFNEKIGKMVIFSPSVTLITKVMLGTLACVPAYDRNFKDGINNYRKQNNSNVRRHGPMVLFDLPLLLDIIALHRDEIIEGQKAFAEVDSICSAMKILDTYFWEMGKSLNPQHRE